MGKTFEEVKAWRKATRERLIAERAALAADTVDAWRRSIDATLERSFPGLATQRVAFCWPIKNEYDARHFARTLRDKGAVTALPVVVGRGQPLVFREWHPGVKLAKGGLDIPYPVDSQEVVPQAVLLPMNGWDQGGYRLGYGAGFFDRTLAALDPRPVVIGVTYECARLETIYPQPWDIPADYVVTERGLYRRDEGGLAFLGLPEPAGSGSLASPVCYADEAYYTRNSR
ncbi:MAG TPA: 5-formyltetrahydrofolate cyclo-ligase [Burkholderiales bacterium]|nr:5-formyltetrahydrofolate cyclo-ligase [Burkholderiales bacterium]